VTDYVLLQAEIRFYKINWGQTTVSDLPRLKIFQKPWSVPIIAIR